MFCTISAMIEHDVQSSRHWAMDGELAAVAYRVIIYIRTS